MARDCTKFLRDSFKGMSEKDINNLSRSLEARATIMSRDGVLSHADALKKVSDEASNKILRSIRVGKLNTLRNRAVKIETTANILNLFKEDFGAGLEAKLVGIQSNIKTARGNVALAIDAEETHAMNVATSDIDRAGLTHIIRDKANATEIFEVANVIDTKGDLSGFNPDIVKLVQTMQKHSESSRVNANAAGGDINKLDGRLFSRNHDAAKINKVGAVEWTAFMNRALSAENDRGWERSFPDMVDPARRTELLDKMFLEFASGVHVKSSSPETSGFKGVASIGKGMSHSRVIHFSTPKLEAEYHAKFGVGSVADAFFSSIRTTARKTALMRQLGPNARDNWNAVTSKLLEVATSGKKDAEGNIVNKPLSKGMLKKLTKSIGDADNLYWPYLDGSDRVPGNHMLANAFGIARAVEVFSKLHSATLAAFGDPTFFGAEAARQGVPFLRGVGDSLAGIFKGVNPDEGALLSELGVSIEGLSHGVASRMSVDEPISGNLAKLQQQYFKFNLLQPWTDRQRRAFGLGMSHRLALAKRNGLGSEMAQILSLYGIGEKEWSVLRQAKGAEISGREYFTTESISELPDKTISDYMNSVGLVVNKTSVEATKVRLSESMRMAFSDRVDHAVVQTDVKTRGMMMRGQQRGTIVGEGLGSLMQFKAFSAAVLQKSIGADFFGRSSSTTWTGAARDSVKNGAMFNIARTVMTATAMGYVAMSLKDLTKGRKPRDPTSKKTWVAAMLQGGALGIYGDFLFGDLRNRYGGSALGTLAGPILGDVSLATDLVTRAASGENVAAKAVSFGKRLLPNTFYTKLPLDMMVLWDVSERASPGWSNRMQKNLKKNNDQEYFKFAQPNKFVSR